MSCVLRTILRIIPITRGTKLSTYAIIMRYCNTHDVDYSNLPGFASYIEDIFVDHIKYTEYKLTWKLCSVENVHELFQLAELFRDDTSCTTRSRATWSFILLFGFADIWKHFQSDGNYLHVDRVRGLKCLRFFQTRNILWTI